MDRCNTNDEPYILNITKDICDSIEEIERTLTLIKFTSKSIWEND